MILYLIAMAMTAVFGVIQSPAQSTNQRSGSSVTVRGVVNDAQTGQPLYGATVQQIGTSRGAVTNRIGAYTIRCVGSDTIRLRVSYVGYAQAQVSVLASSATIDADPITLLVSSQRQQEVVVSANKRVQAVQDVPISVSIVKADDLSQRGIVRLDEALRYVSGISIARDQVSIRGASGFALGVGSRTMVMMDDVYE